jgi:hypothetical protein
LLVVLGERSEVVRSGSGGNGCERHVWLRGLCVSGRGSGQWRLKSHQRFVAARKPRLRLPWT